MESELIKNRDLKVLTLPLTNEVKFIVLLISNDLNLAKFVPASTDLRKIYRALYLYDFEEAMALIDGLEKCDLVSWLKDSVLERRDRLALKVAGNLPEITVPDRINGRDFNQISRNTIELQLQ